MINEVFEKVVKSLFAVDPSTKAQFFNLFAKAYQDRGFNPLDQKPEDTKTAIRHDALKAMVEVLEEVTLEFKPIDLEADKDAMNLWKENSKYVEDLWKSFGIPAEMMKAGTIKYIN